MFCPPCGQSNTNNALTAFFAGARYLRSGIAGSGLRHFGIVFWPFADGELIEQVTLDKIAVGIQAIDVICRQIIERKGGDDCWLSFLHISSPISLIGFVICVFTKRQKVVHDLIAKTLVVHTEVTTQDLERYPNIRADTVQKMTAAGALAIIRLFILS